MALINDAELTALIAKQDKNVDDYESIQNATALRVNEAIVKAKKFVLTLSREVDKPAKGFLTELNNNVETLWGYYSESLDAVVKLYVSQIDNLQDEMFEKDKINDEEDQIKELQIRKQGKKIAQLESEIAALRAQLAENTSTATGAQATLASSIKGVTIAKPKAIQGARNISEAVLEEGTQGAPEINNRPAGKTVTRFDFDEEQRRLGHYIGVDGRIYDEDQNLVRNGGTRRKRQRRGRKSRR